MAAKRFKENLYQGYPDVHMNTAKGGTLADVRMATAKNTLHDVHMNTAKNTLRPEKFTPRQRKLLSSPEIQRKATVAQLCTCVLPRDVACAHASEPLPAACEY